MAFTDAVDSHYNYVKTRILAINPVRVFGGLLNAQDWPSKPIKYDAFYLLLLGEDSVGRQGYSASTPIKFHQIQWSWITKGTDLPLGVRQANRGDRYRTVQLMKSELLTGLFPNYAEKKSWGLVGGTYTGTSKNPQEFNTWTPVSFHEKYDKDSGMIYGSGSLRIQDMLDTITA